MQAHSFQIHGLRWTYEPDYLESGFKNAQSMGISEHFEMLFRLPPNTADHAGGLPFADYLISPSSSIDGLANGTWGILRAYGKQTDSDPTSKNHLAPLINNPIKELPGKQAMLTGEMEKVKGTFASNTLPENYKRFAIHATTVFKVLADRPLEQRVLSFNPRFSMKTDPGSTAYNLNNALLFVRHEDLDNGKTLRRSLTLEPLILRVAAGDWVEITLVNDLDDDKNDPALTMTNMIPPPNTTNVTPFGANGFANVSLSTSRRAGLHPALVDFNVTEANGINVGFNPEATVGKGDSRKFYWYAGDVSLVPVFDEDGNVTDRRVAETPIEYGATNLVPAEMMIQPQFGMVGALIVEPEGSRWVEDRGTRASATVTPRNGRPFRDFVMVAQNMVGNIVPTWGAINYRTEPFVSRFVDPVTADSQANAVSMLVFADSAGGVTLETLKSRDVKGINVWGSRPQPVGNVLAQATVKLGVPAGTTLDFFCSQHGPMMNGSLSVQAPAGPLKTVEIHGDNVGGTPTWTFNGNKAVNVPVQPGDTVVWKVVQGQHGVVFDPKPPLGMGYGMAYSNDQLVPSQDPVTPVFRAVAGEPVRFRLVMPSTSTINALSPPVTFDIHGHGWPEEPYARERIQMGEGSFADAFNPFGLKIGRNVRSQFFGAQQVGPYEAFNFVIDHAGGLGRQEGDYLYEALQRTQFPGLWGLFRA